MSAARVTFFVIAFLAALARAASAQGSTDPCGGPQEMLNKIGTTPCVFVFGEVLLNESYTSVANTNNYLQSQVVAGVSPRSQITMTPATNAAGWQFAYRQLLSAAKNGTTTGLELSYQGSPNYGIDPLLSLALPANFSFSVDAFVNVATGSGGGWAFEPTFGPSWQSPGGTLLGISVTHYFSPNLTPIDVSVEQLLSRQFVIELDYGNAAISRTRSGPIGGRTTPITANTRVLSASVSYLIGKSEPSH